MTEPLYIDSARDSVRIIIDSLCIARNLNRKQLIVWVDSGMPDPREGASFDDCMGWIYRNRYSDAELAKDLGLRPAKLTILRRKGMPSLKNEATIEEIKEWVEIHFRENFSTYGMEKTLGLCRKTIEDYIRKGMANPHFGADPEKCEEWIEWNYDRLNPISKLVVKSGKSYDAIVRRIKKEGMPDPRDGASISKCLKWMHRKMSYTEVASILGISLSTLINWVKIHKMPNPTKGASLQVCLDWINENQSKLQIRSNTKLGKVLSPGFFGDRKLHWYDFANLKYMQNTPIKEL
jgi:transposase